MKINRDLINDISDHLNSEIRDYTNYDIDPITIQTILVNYFEKKLTNKYISPLYNNGGY